ncbi:MAG: DSD1 family PLP-dependent enzyme [Burkholderiaceae bacterium]|nr:DSD1 family PLP-dependent enzyme [Burkholderiaceae bacterium]
MRSEPNFDWRPARPGDALQDVDTPALILDLGKFESNLTRLMQAVKAYGVRVRPHAKSHKCVQVARRQIESGAVGICVQKLSEAAVFLAGGIDDVLITNEVVGAAKLRRLVELAQRHPQARLGVCVDDAGVVRQLAQQCDALDARVDVYVELDVGQNRCGLVTPHEAVDLARVVVASPRLNFMGLHAYAGSAQHRRGVPERRAATEAAAQKAHDARAALRAADLPCERITGGGTGTFVYEAASAVYNEIQPGSYVLMDADYARNAIDPQTPRFEHALAILSTVMSVRQADGNERATLDAGLKAFSTDSGPAVPTFGGWRPYAVSDEHTVLHKVGDGPVIRLGDKALLVPGHCDPTVALHDWIVAVRDGRVEDVWPVDARGALF